jgi:hypothetical protein
MIYVAIWIVKRIETCWYVIGCLCAALFGVYGAASVPLTTHLWFIQMSDEQWFAWVLSAFLALLAHIASGEAAEAKQDAIAYANRTYSVKLPDEINVTHRTVEK